MPRYSLRTLLILLAIGPIAIVTAWIASNGGRSVNTFDFTALQGVERSYKPATENEVRDVERKLGVRFPDDYRDFLKSINGISSISDNTSVDLEVPMKTRIGTDDEPWAINSLYSISSVAEPHDQLIAYQQAYRFNKRVPERYVIIGGTFGPDKLCLSCAAPDHGKVYFWLPDDGSNEQTSEEPTVKGLWPAADSFLEFWSKLRLGQ